MKTKLKSKKVKTVLKIPGEAPIELKSKKIDYKAHWKGMPEFEQPGAEPIKSLIVNFATNEDMHKFSKLVGQLITAKTRFIWYPFVEDEKYIDKRWSDKIKKNGKK